MRFEIKRGTGRASCRTCGERIEKGAPHLEIIHGKGRYKRHNKICRPCLEETARAVRNLL